MLTRAPKQLQVANSQFVAAVKEIERPQPKIDTLDKDGACRARGRPRVLLLEMKVQDVRRQGWEEGREQGLEWSSSAATGTAGMLLPIAEAVPQIVSYPHSSWI